MGHVVARLIHRDDRLAGRSGLCDRRLLRAGPRARTRRHGAGRPRGNLGAHSPTHVGSANAHRPSARLTATATTTGALADARLRPLAATLSHGSPPPDTAPALRLATTELSTQRPEAPRRCGRYGTCSRSVADMRTAPVTTVHRARDAKNTRHAPYAPCAFSVNHRSRPVRARTLVHGEINTPADAGEAR